jgi:hypothetical protein
MMADRSSLSRRAIFATALVALAVMIVIVAINAPANWLALYVSRETRDAVLLADAQGTIWAGSAVVALGSPGAGAAAPEQLALPGRVTWTLEITRALAPVLHLTHDGVLQQPLAIRYAGGDWVIEPGAASLPASMLRLVGAPMNTLLPEGRCTLRWTGLRSSGRRRNPADRRIRARAEPGEAVGRLSADLDQRRSRSDVATRDRAGPADARRERSVRRFDHAGPRGRPRCHRRAEQRHRAARIAARHDRETRPERRGHRVRRAVLAGRDVGIDAG